VTGTPILDLGDVGKSYRSYRSVWWRAAGWISGEPSHFADHWVLRNVSFAARAGESIGVVGRNGAGKTTLLKLIAGTLAATEGRVDVRGRVSAILELGMGFNQEFTGRQNARHACGLLGYEQQVIADSMPWIESFADVGAYFDAPLRTYSSGMQMRLAFAVATLTRPDILIVDEALSVGDLSFQAKCFERINAFRRDGTTLLYVTHGVGDVVKHCERALLIREGRLVLDGPSRDVTNQYLDDLFGRRAATPDLTPLQPSAQLPEQAAREAPTALDGDDTDRFETRPGYRKDEHRWGAGGARIVDFHLAAGGREFPSEVESGAVLRLAFKVRFDRPVRRPVYGLLIKTLEGLFVYGTKSTVASGGGAAAHAAHGDVVVARFAWPMRLNTGAYLLSVGVSEDDEDGELAPLDRRYDAIILTVRHAGRISGLADLEATFTATATARRAVTA
jgi:lipopolysaccharide transport system ATP-binding protein